MITWASVRVVVVPYNHCLSFASFPLKDESLAPRLIILGKVNLESAQ
jgi:hypothetical protein